MRLGMRGMIIIQTLRPRGVAILLIAHLILDYIMIDTQFEKRITMKDDPQLQPKPTNRLLEVCLWCNRNGVPDEIKEAMQETAQYIQWLEALRGRVDIYIDNEESHLKILRRLCESVED